MYPESLVPPYTRGSVPLYHGGQGEPGASLHTRKRLSLSVCVAPSAWAKYMGGDPLGANCTANCGAMGPNVGPDVIVPNSAASFMVLPATHCPPCHQSHSAPVVATSSTTKCTGARHVIHHIVYRCGAAQLRHQVRAWQGRADDARHVIDTHFEPSFS